VLAGCSAHRAAVKVREKALKVAGSLLQLSAGDLDIEGAYVCRKGGLGQRVSLAEIARATAGSPGFYLPGGVTPGMEATEHVVIDDMAYSNGTAVVEVEVDIETGAVSIHNIVFAHDCGKVIHPKIVEGQILGGVAHGVGNALFEWMAFDEEGQPVTTTLADYLLVTATEMAPVILLHQESPTPLNELGVKGVGEAGTLPTAAAIVSAIENALSGFGVHITRTPIRPAEIAAQILANRGDEHSI
jgi:aerobic carbon-monoxide dehydrogenase large subunit